MIQKSFYLRNLKPKLLDLVQLSRGTTSPVDRLSLQEEVDLMRVLSSSQIDAMMEVALEPVDESASADERKKQWIAKHTAGEMCKRALADVSSLVQKAAQVRSLATDAATVDDIQFVMEQVVAIVQQVVGNVDPILAATVVAQIENVKMPNRDRSLPDAQALLVRAVEEIAENKVGQVLALEEKTNQAEEKKDETNG